jgi:potassium-transporting ATPase KdpC subunit
VFRHVRASCIVLLIGTLLFGVVYPLAIWTLCHIFFPHQAEGSPVSIEKGVCGLHNVGQTFSSDAYFWGRPSARPILETEVIVSGASNLPWSSPKLRSIVEARKKALLKTDERVPNDLIMASASGIDPEISFQSAVFQIPRIAKARNMQESELRALICYVEEPTMLGLFPRRVNVLKLNLELDRHGMKAR